MKIPNDMICGHVHSSNSYGDVEIVEYKDVKNVTVKFLNTGFTYTTGSSEIRRGRLKDYLSKLHYFGVGYFGVGPYTTSCKAYKVWVAMLERCYNRDPARAKKNIAYSNVTVCDDWHNYQQFAKWFINNHKEGYQLDKDLKSGTNKEYSPSTCVFLSPKQNKVLAQEKKHFVKHPSGEVTEIVNLERFCEENNLDRSGLYKTKNGLRKHYKGFVLLRGHKDAETDLNEAITSLQRAKELLGDA